MSYYKGPLWHPLSPSLLLPGQWALIRPCLQKLTQAWRRLRRSGKSIGRFQIFTVSLAVMITSAESLMVGSHSRGGWWVGEICMMRWTFFFTVHHRRSTIVRLGQRMGYRYMIEGKREAWVDGVLHVLPVFCVSIWDFRGLLEPCRKTQSQSWPFSMLRKRPCVMCVWGGGMWEKFFITSTCIVYSDADLLHCKKGDSGVLYGSLCNCPHVSLIFGVCGCLMMGVGGGRWG